MSRITFTILIVGLTLAACNEASRRAEDSVGSAAAAADVTTDLPHEVVASDPGRVADAVSGI